VIKEKIMYLINRCAISRKELQESDDVVSFPFFDSKPGEPKSICCEDIALRSEFEKWYLRDRVIQKVRDFWFQWSQMKKDIAILILAENENFLITKGIYDKGVALFFLNHVFYVWVAIDIWDRFVDLILTSDKGELNTFGEHSFHWGVDTTQDNMIVQIKSVRKDTIVIPMAEWLNLQELVSVIR
jgi:hypothetical protein